jgi:adenylylsulfate kinase
MSSNATCIWLTGLPGAGKSTLAALMRQVLANTALEPVVVDADGMRTRLNRDLGFSRQDRRENVRRIAEVARLFAENGQTPIVACISPYVADRSMAREILMPHNVLEVFVDAPVDVCRRRDPKGLYAQAAKGTIKGLVGFDVDYEPPVTGAAVVRTHMSSPRACVDVVLSRLFAATEPSATARYDSTLEP